MGTAPMELVELSEAAEARPRHEVVETLYKALSIPSLMKLETAGAATQVGVQELGRQCRRYWWRYHL